MVTPATLAAVFDNTKGVMPLFSPGNDPRISSAHAPARQSVSWWALVSLFVVLVIALFIPWNGSQSGPTVDVRPELVWSVILTVVFGAIGLATHNRWISYVAMLPTLGAITDLGPVFLPESGHYPLLVKIVVVLVSAVGVIWLVRAFDHPPRGQSTRWVIAPVAAVLTIATLWLPWVIVSGIGEESGQMTAFSLLFGTNWVAATGLMISNIVIVVVMVVGVGAALLPLATRRPSINRIATIGTLAAAVIVVLFVLGLAVRGDEVQAAVGVPGPRVALAGLLLLALTWHAHRGIDDDSAHPTTDGRITTGSHPVVVITTLPIDPNAPGDLALSTGPLPD